MGDELAGTTKNMVRGLIHPYRGLTHRNLEK